MSYCDDISNDLKPFYTLQEEEDLCFECGESISAGVVRYDGYTAKEHMKSIFYHPKCANLVGQRLIADGYKNRRKN